MKQISLSRYILLIAFTFATTVSCANKKPVDESTRITSESKEFFGEASAKPDKPEAISPDWQRTKSLKYVPFNFTTGKEIEALIAVTSTGALFGASQVFKSPESRKDLNGSCTYGDPNSAMQTNCINVTVNLLNDKKEIEATATTNREGQFRFYIPIDKKYFVQVIDKKGRSALTESQLGRSEFIALYLKP